MKYLFRKIGITFLVLVLVVTPLTSLLKVPVAADPPVWVPLTNPAFASINDQVKQVVGMEDAYFYTTERTGRNLDIYAFFDGDNELISQELIDDTDNLSIIGIAVMPFGILAAVDTVDGIHIMASTGPDEWADVTGEIFPGPVSEVKYFSSVEGNLIILVSLEEDETTNYVWLELTSEGEYKFLGSAVDFTDIDFSSAYIASVEKAEIGGDGNAYIVAIDDEDGGHIFAMGDAEEGDVFEFPSLSQVSSLILVNGLGLFAAEVDTGDGATIYRMGEAEWDLVFQDPTSFSITLSLLGEDQIVAATSNTEGNNSTIYATANGSTWDLLSSYVGEIGDPGEKNSWTNVVVSVPGGLLVATSRYDEGPNHASLWGFIPGEDPSTIDTDNDGVLDIVENAGPNGGDANNDGTLDSQQPNVTVITNPNTDHYVVLQSDGDYTISLDMLMESEANPDVAFSYPAGLMNFQIQSGGPGQVVTITQYFYGDYDATLMVARKYDETTHTYILIPGAILTNEIIGGESVLKVVYQITDGDPTMDLGQEPDGIIVDPSGPALNSVIVPNTGLGGNHSTEI